MVAIEGCDAAKTTAAWACSRAAIRASGVFGVSEEGAGLDELGTVGTVSIEFEGARCIGAAVGGKFAWGCGEGADELEGAPGWDTDVNTPGR